MTVFERIQKILCEHLGVEREKVTHNSHFYDDLGADSMDVISLIQAFEEEFGIAIPDDVAEFIMTPQEAMIQLETGYNIQ